MLTAQVSSAKSNSLFSVLKSYKSIPALKKSARVAQSAVFKSVNVSAGGLLSALTKTEKSTVTNLTITGTIDARDFKIMRDSMSGLSVIDISSVGIVAYTGNDGTGYSSTTYPANEIPEYAFFNTTDQQFNTTLTSIQLPSSITSIGSTAFALCSALSSINISSSVVSFGQTVFTGCSATIIVDANNPKFASIDGVLFDKTVSTLLQCPTLKTGSYIVPTSVTKIDMGAFYACSTLTSINIPASVLEIGQFVFYNCSSLTSIYLNSRPVILAPASDVFALVNTSTCILYVPYGAKNLYQVAGQWSDFANIVESSQGFILDASNVKISAASSSSTTITVKANVLWSTNSDQSWLTVTPNSGYGNATLTLTAQANQSETPRTATVTVSSLGYSSQTIKVTQSVFAKTINVTAGGLSNVLTPAGLISYSNLILKGTIDARDFKVMRDSMPLLSDLDLSGINIAAYSGMDGTSYNSYYPANTIPDRAFYYANSSKVNQLLSTIILPTSITSIGYSAFRYCTSLATIIIPASVTAIESESFYGCSGLTSVTIGNFVTTIGYAAFSDCSKLTNVTIPTSVTDISDRAFSGCTALTGFTVLSGNLSYSSLDGVLFNQNKTSLIQYPVGKQGSYTVPATVGVVRAGSFVDCSKLTSITIPDGVYLLGGDTATFTGCKLLTAFTVTTGNSTFASIDGVLCNKVGSAIIQCPQGKSGVYVIPSTIKTIQNSAFMNCSGLTGITIPGSVTSIDNYAFESCIGLTSIYTNSNPIDLSSNDGVFSGVNTNTCILYVPYGSKSLYANANSWSNFKNIVENSQGFSFDKNSVKLDAKAGSNANVNISANVPWSTSSDQTWLTASPGNGSGNGTLTLTATANPTVSSRTAIVTVSATGVSSQAITVVQAGAPKVITVIAGGLFASLTTDELSSISRLQLSGTIDARDFKTMRDNMPLLAEVDLSAASIVAYSGSYGTSMYTTQYLANVIPDYAFYSNSTWTGKNSLTMIVLPSSATSIGSQAFNYCQGLISCSIGNSLITFDTYVFSGCSALTAIIVTPSNANYSSVDGVLFNKNQTTLVLYPIGKSGTTYTIPSTVTSIGDNAFSNAKIQSISIPNSVISIGNNAFQNCNYITSISMGSSLTTIGSGAFYSSGLKSIDIPSAVSSIGSSAFSYCYNLTQFTVQSINANFSATNGVLFNKSQTTLIQNVLNDKLTYVIPSTVTTITDYAFQNSNKIIKINIPKSVTSIGNYAFESCYNLDSVIVNAPTPVDLSSKYSVFSNIKSSCTLFVPIGSKILYVAASQWNSIPNIVETESMSKTVNITSPGTLSIILTADQLNTINKLTITGTIDARDFKTMRDLMPLLTNLDISGVSIAAYTGTAGTYSTSSIVYPANEVPADAFYNPTSGSGKISLTSVTLPLNITSIGNYAFQRCSGLTGVYIIPSSVINIGNYAFNYCSKLTNVTLPAALTTIGTYAFYGCSAITGVTIPTSVTSIGIAAFSYCNYLTAITVQSGNNNYSSVDGILFNKNQTSLLQYPGAKAGSYIIPSTVTSIADYAFYYCSGLTGVTIPATVTTIGNYTFYNCYVLTNVTIPSAVTTIGNYAFTYCTSLTTITIPSAVTSIGTRAFNYCTKLTAINVESGNLNYSGISGVLFDKNQNTLIQYPGAKAGSYIIPGTVTSIADYAFYYCNKLTSIDIPSAVKTIGNYAFYYCSGLTSIYVNSKPIALSSSYTFTGVNTTTSTLYVPFGTKALYTATSFWNSFVNIVESTSGFVLDVNNLIVSAAAGSSNVSIAANIAWVTISDKTWLTVSPSSGSGNNILSLIVQANTSDISRTATVTVSAIGVTSQTITVTQEGLPKTIFVTAGNLATTLTADQLNGISDLTISGTIDARDFKTMRDKMPLLAKLDISNVSILAYTGLDGTVTNVSATYPQNTIPDFAFSLPVTYVGKISLKNIVFPTSLTSIGNTTFENCTGLTGNLLIPNSVTTIGSYAFYGCTGFTGILKIPSLVSSIGIYAFAYCSGFSGTLNIPSMLTSISNYTFFSCGGLTGSLIIPSSVTSIGESAFGICSGLTSASIPWSVSSVGIYAFRRTNILFSVDANNQNYSSIDGILFNKNQNTLIQYPISKTGSYSIPSSVNTIGSGAFDYCSGLTSVTIPLYVNSIGASAFYNAGLTSIYAHAVTPVDLSLSSYVFDGINKATCTLYVPTGSKNLYQSAVQWKDFTNIVEFITATPNVLNGESIRVYPNPVTSGFYVNGFDGDATLSITDLNGRTVLNRKVVEKEYVLVQSLSKGVYIVKLISDRGSVTQRIVKQ
jgi:hypothetical protein